MDHCILWPLYSLFSPCQWSLSLTVAHRKHHHPGLGRAEDEERSEENAIVCAHVRWIDRERREHNTGTAARSLAGGPRLFSTSICRYSPRVRYYRAWNARCWRAFQAHVGLRLSSWQFTVLACDSSLSREATIAGSRAQNPSVLSLRSSAQLSRCHCLF